MNPSPEELKEIEREQQELYNKYIENKEKQIQFALDQVFGVRKEREINTSLNAIKIASIIIIVITILFFLMR